MESGRTRSRGRRNRYPERLLVAIALVGMPALAARASESHISQDDLLRAIGAGDAPAIVDVRTRRAFDKGHVPGALHIPFWAMAWRTSQVPTSPEEPVVIYCEHGPRAGLAKAALRAAGFREVLYLEGHMSGWKRAGLPQEATTPPR
jgi:rhodanese-related sulfurtransferase